MKNSTRGQFRIILGGLLIIIGLGCLIFTRYGWVITVVGFGFLSIGASLIKEGSCLKQATLDELLEQDDRNPVLFLRAFKRDSQEINSNSFGSFNMLHQDFYLHKGNDTFEERLSNIVSPLGPFIGIGKPKERLQPIGASRVYVTDDEWQEKVISLAKKSSYAIILIDDTSSVKWELKTLTKLIGLEKIILLIPILNTNKKNHIGWYNKVSKLINDIGYNVQVNSDTVAYYFTDNEINTVVSSSTNILKRLKSLTPLVNELMDGKKGYKNNRYKVLTTLIPISAIIIFLISSAMQTNDRKNSNQVQRMFNKTLNSIPELNNIEEAIGTWECTQKTITMSTVICDKGDIIIITNDKMTFFGIPMDYIIEKSYANKLVLLIKGVNIKMFITIVDKNNLLILNAKYKRVSSNQ